MPKTKRRAPKKTQQSVESFTVYQQPESPCFWAIGHRYGSNVHTPQKALDGMAERLDGGVYESASDAARALVLILERSEADAKGDGK